MIKVVFKNNETEIFDGDSAENDKFGAFIIMKKQGQEVGLIAISEIKALFVKGELGEGDSWEDVDLSQLLESENGKRVRSYVSRKFGERIKGVHMHIDFSIESVNETSKRAPNLISEQYRIGYNEALIGLKRELMGIHIL